MAVAIAWAIAIFNLSSSPLGRSRSRKTSPELSITTSSVLSSAFMGCVLVRWLFIVSSVVLFSSFQSCFDLIELMLWGCYSLLCFLLEDMKDVNCLLELHGVDSPECVTIVVDDNF